VAGRKTDVRTEKIVEAWATPVCASILHKARVQLWVCETPAYALQVHHHFLLTRGLESEVRKCLCRFVVFPYMSVFGVKHETVVAVVFTVRTVHERLHGKVPKPPWRVTVPKTVHCRRHEVDGEVFQPSFPARVVEFGCKLLRTVLATAGFSMKTKTLVVTQLVPGLLCHTQLRSITLQHPHFVHVAYSTLGRMDRK
jgi:hypothetical protein